MLVLITSLLACRPEPPADTDVVETEDTEVDTIDTALPNRPPGAPVVAVTPPKPPSGRDFSAVITTESTDPDGDALTYAYAWTVDGVGSSVTTAVVPGAMVVDGQVWVVSVTANDGELSGPAATASATVGNAAPTAPGLSWSPTPPVEGQALELVFDPVSVDEDGDPITTTITWYENDIVVPWYQDLTVIERKYVSIYDTFRAVVSVTDGYHDPLVVESSITVEYGCDNLPEFNLGDTTLSASAYHGITFDDDGNLIGLDTASSSVLKSGYDGTASLFLPGVSGLQQMDRLPDGDFVMGDGFGGRLLRVSPTGSTETIAGGLSGIYGVTVGPEGKVYVSNGSVIRIDPDTGEAETLIGGGHYAHDVAFNLDSTVLYIGTIGSGVLYVELDADLDTVGSVKTYATGATYIDGLEVDECGNVYAADYSTANLYRYTPDGETTSMVSGGYTQYGHGVAWGRGIGGWATDTLYQPQPYNGDTVREVVIGLQSGDSVRTWNGVAVPW